MSVWIRNLRTTLEDRPVVILHGNVRDRYIDQDRRVYENLTSLLTQVARDPRFAFSELLFYDPVSHERRVSLTEPPASRARRAAADPELAATAPIHEEDDGSPRPAAKPPPARQLATWLGELADSSQKRMAVLYYLDKLVAYKAAYQNDEKEMLLWLERVIENISDTNRLILVALQDSMVPVELYTAAPKTSVLPIPAPDKADRLAYLEHRLGREFPQIGLVADLTDGLFLRDIDNIAADLRETVELSAREVRRLVNKYRIGEQEDHWGTLSIERLNNALGWFTQEEGVKGQNEAIQEVVEMLCLARAGLSGVASGTASKPKGVLFFAGPTGVGKTFVAKKLAKFLFSTEEAFLRFDMSEFKEEHTVSKLIGSPPGYVGFERGGMLTNAVRERPFSVILFDEIEKAHPKIMDIFLQILDEGRLTDSRGQTVFFTEAVIIFTSNLGTRTTDSQGRPLEERSAIDNIIRDPTLDHEEKKRRIREHFAGAVERFFMFEISRPELLNRIGNNIVPFNYIHSSEVQTDIVRSHLKRIKEDFEERYRSARYTISIGADLAPWLVQRYGEQMAAFGGRGITNALEDELMKPLSRAVLRAEHEGRQGVTFLLTVNADGCGVSVEM